MPLSPRPFGHTLLALAASAAVAVWAVDPAPYTQATGPARAAENAEAEIAATVATYARAWYEGNAAMLSTTLHPEFVRQTIRRSPTKMDAIDNASGLALLDMVDRGYGRMANAAQRKAEVTEVRVHGGVGTATLALADRVESLQLVRWNNRWRVIQSVTERTEP